MGPVPFAIVIRDLSEFPTYFFSCASVSSRELSSGRALRIAFKSGQDAAEFKNCELLLRTWLNDSFYFLLSSTCVGLFLFPFWLRSHNTLTGGSLANLDSRLDPYAVNHSSISGSR